MADKNFVLFCKSYEKDVYRARRLARSVDQWNRDGIEFYVSVPENDLRLFKDVLNGTGAIFITDEEILKRTCDANGPIPTHFAPHLMQQLVKLEFWRTGICQNYAWIDSDSYFIKEFKLTDFMYDSQTPYTIRQVYDVQKKLERWQSVPERMVQRRIRDALAQIEKFKGLFGHSGKNYDFGVSTPIIWSAKVLRHLNETYLKEKQQSIFSLLSDYPCETFLYGYYLMHSNCVPLHPKRHMFKNFDYAEEFIASQIEGENEASLSRDFWGICIQSNWTLFPQKKSLTTRLQSRKQEFLSFIAKLSGGMGK